MCHQFSHQPTGKLAVPLLVLLLCCSTSGLVAGWQDDADQWRRPTSVDDQLKLVNLSAELALPANSSSSRQMSVVESLFGQVAKTVVYAGAEAARLNSRLLCSLLTQETELDNEDQPTLFVFNDQHNKDNAFRIYADDEINESLLSELNLDPNQMTFIFVHGWLGGIHNELWLSEAKSAVLSATSDQFQPNVIIVEWSEFAQGSLYTATQNSFKVARRLARLLSQLASEARLKPELMHCLGHSIGTHICGQAARQAFPAQPRPAGSSHEEATRRAAKRRMGRITGLDPGGFCYELGIHNESQFAGLRPSDALLVDAYYSNRSPFGNKYQVAQHNVRINNGFFQRPCSVWRNPEVAQSYFRAAVRFLMGNVGHNDILTCDHYFATRFAHQQPTGCSYVAYACSSYRDFARGRCGLCQRPGQCYTMDFEYQRSGNSSPSHALEHIHRHSSFFNQAGISDEELGDPLGGVAYDNRKIYYMRVANEPPYCSQTYRVRVRLNLEVVDLNEIADISGRLKLSFLDHEHVMLRLKDGPSGKLVEELALYGPWPPNEQQGVDSRTLTALFELQPGEWHRQVTIRGLIVDFDDRNLSLGRGDGNSTNPVELVQLDYLSSSDDRIRVRYSRNFGPNQFSLFCRQADGARRRQVFVEKASSYL